MTDIISADLAKALASAKPAAKPIDKLGAKLPDTGKPGDAPPPAPGSKTFLGWIAKSVTKKQLTVAAAAVLSLVAGIAAVRLIWPEDEKPTTGTTQLYVPETNPPPAAPPRTGPTLTIDPPKPGEYIPPPSLPIPPTLPSGGVGTIPPPSGVIIPPPPGGVIPPPSGVIPPPSGLDTLPTIPIPGVGPSTPIPPPSGLVPPVVPAGGAGSFLPIPPASGGTLPAIPSVVPPSLPSSPGMLTIPPAPMDLNPSAPKPPPPITGVPPSSSLPTSPSGSGILVPPPPTDLSPSGSGAKIEFIKPADNNTVTPVAGTSRAPTTSYDVDIYHPKQNDTWEAISREFYSDTKYAGALRSYNQTKNQSLTSGTLDVPPIHVLRRTAPSPATGTPTGRPPAAPDPWGAAGATTPGGFSGSKTFRVPNGDGMSLPAVAKLLLGTEQRWDEIYRLNPDVNPNKVPAGTELKLPADARVQ